MASQSVSLGIEPQTSLFVASYDSQGHGGGIRPRLHTGTSQFPFPYSPISSRHGPRTENTAPLLLRAGPCLQSCCLATRCNIIIHKYAIILQLPTQFNSSAPKLISRQAGVSKLDSSLYPARDRRYMASRRTHRKHRFLCCCEGMFITPLHSNESYLIAACVFVAVEMCLPSCCLAVNVYSDVTIPAFGRHVAILL
jgi:hypothetical protein